MIPRTTIRCPNTIDSSTPIGRLEVIDTEGLVIEPPLSCKEDKTGRGTTVNQSHVHVLQGIKWNPACQGGILVAVDAARGLSRGISEWEKSESPFRQRSFLPKEFSKKSSQPDSISEIPIDRRIERTERKIYVYDE
ncbi:hypothetical protein ALC56_13302 [Trachymyrmex septentrionalis]|uniref:Uncharacterized protein n=1 Tax=Trachymyrmex septentrionalis TaxID=34720 RepID=A0A195EW03_9HYME|nr:hypothetical protein ALC56_13302 [Trachymyrmex septentrionalis]